MFKSILFLFLKISLILLLISFLLLLIYFYIQAQYNGHFFNFNERILLSLVTSGFFTACACPITAYVAYAIQKKKSD